MSKYPLFIILLAIYPGLALLAWNFREVNANVVVRPLLFSVLLTLLLVAINILLIRNTRKAILVSTVFLVIFFSFGHLALLIDESSFFGMVYFIPACFSKAVVIAFSSSSSVTGFIT